jgi:hypothetical protein
MALEDLIARLEREAQSRVDAVLEKARAEAAAVDRQAAQDTSRERAAVLAERRARRRAQLDRELGLLRVKLRAAELAARQRVLECIFERARALSRASAVPSQLSAARAYLPGRLRARCAPDLADAVRAAGIEVAGEAQGLVLDDGDCTIDLSPAALLSRRRAQLFIELAKELPQ